MLQEHIELREAELLAVPAGALVVEDNCRLSGAHGYAAALDRRYGELRPLREQARGAVVYAPGTALAFRSHDGMLAIWVVTYGEGATGARATPLDIAAASRAALLLAAEHGARQVAMPALGTRSGQHVLPAVPKKLPRYVMAAAQLIGIREALERVSSTRVTLCLTQRDKAIFAAVLGLGGQADDSDDDA